MHTFAFVASKWHIHDPYTIVPGVPLLSTKH